METLLLLLGLIALLPVFLTERMRRPCPAPCTLRDATPLKTGIAPASGRKGCSKRSHTTIAMSAGLVLMTGCAKEPPTAPVALGALPPATGNFIRFTENGIAKEYTTGAMATYASAGAAHIWSGVASSPTTQNAAAFTTILDSNIHTPITVTTTSSQPITAVLISMMGDVTVLDDDLNYDLHGTGSGSITFTRLDTVPGGRVEGTFQYTSVELLDADEDVVSTGHNFSNGSFSLSIP